MRLDRHFEALSESIDSFKKDLPERMAGSAVSLSPAGSKGVGRRFAMIVINMAADIA